MVKLLLGEFSAPTAEESVISRVFSKACIKQDDLNVLLEMTNCQSTSTKSKNLRSYVLLAKSDLYGKNGLTSSEICLFWL